MPITPTQVAKVRRRGKEYRERIAAALLFLIFSPIFIASAMAIKLEGLFNPEARGPIFFREDRISRGGVIRLIKFRTLTAQALAKLGGGPTHIAVLEKQGQLTRVGRFLKQWYLDEMPQLLNVIRGEMFLIGTRPYPIELYEEELARGITRKRDMPAGLTGPVQAHKGEAVDSVALDAEYWAAFKTFSGWKLLWLDLRILLRWIRVQVQHKGLYVIDPKGASVTGSAGCEPVKLQES